MRRSGQSAAVLQKSRAVRGSRPAHRAPEVIADPGVRERLESSSQDVLRSICQVSTSAADLVRFATSVEYAQAAGATTCRVEV